MQSYLNDQETREILVRAEEIQQQQRQDIEIGQRTEDVVAAAEEAGLSREAVLQALRERQSVRSAPIRVGALVFAPTDDEKLYVAEVLTLEDGHANVRYLSGSDHVVLESDLRPFQMLPGQKVRCDWPGWGWWTCTVVSCDRENRIVRASDGWGTTKIFSLKDVYVQIPAKNEGSRNSVRLRITSYLISAVIAGAAIGSVITWLIVR